MKCPTCDVSLTMSERQGIEIDYCPQCRGVWLDRGELDKIIERSNQGQPTQSREIDSTRISYDGEHENNSKHSEHAYRKKKRGGFLGDIFDFGD